MALWGACLITSAQNTINSVYSRYGLGDLNRRGTGQSAALGGTGIGLYTHNSINLLNPASYSSQDTTSFIFDLGLTGLEFNSTSNTGSSRFYSMTLDHMILGFPVTHWLKMSAGLVPFSRTGYYIKEVNRIPVINKEVDMYYQGSGGLNQFYGGASIAPWRFVSFGVNANYIFGSLDQSVNQDFPFNLDFDNYAWRIKSQTHTIVHDFNFTYGLQLHDTIGGINWAAGFTFTPKKDLNAKYNQLIFNYTSASNSYPTPIDTIVPSLTRYGHVSLPASWGAGFSVHTNKLLFAADYYTQDWRKARFLEQSDSLGKMDIYSAGLQFTPNPNSIRSYLAKIQYRLGGYYGNTYLIMHGIQLKDYGMTFGFGLPYKNTNSFFNLNFSIGQRGTTDRNLIRDTYYMFSFSMSLYDYWFVKRKFN